MTIFNFPAGKRPEFMAILDQTGSETYATADDNDTPRYQTLKLGFQQLVTALAEADRVSGAGADEEGGGGLYVVGFADKRSFDHGDINLENFESWWSSLQWAGRTFVMPAYNAVMKHFAQEFGDDRNTVLFLIYVGDGGGDDFRDFERAIEQNPRVYVGAVIIGNDRDSQRAVNDFTHLAETTTRVKIFDLRQQSSTEVRDALVSMVA